MRTTLALCAALVLATDAWAQTAQRPGPSPSPDPNAIVLALLRSADARDQAWGSWYVGRDRLTHFLPAVLDIVRHRQTGGSIAERAAADVALDTLIQLDAQVPAEVLADIYAMRSAQALILASRQEGSTEFLVDVLGSAHGPEWFAAANMLTARRASGLAVALLDRMTLKLEVYVSDSGGIGGGSGEGIATGCGVIGLAPGLPPWASYTLATYARPGLVVLESGPTPVYYQRTVAPAGQSPAGSSISTIGPRADYRLRYIAAIAGIPQEQLPLKGIEFHSLQWQGPAQFARALTGLREDLVNRYGALIRLLSSAGLLLANETFPQEPAIDVAVYDFRHDRSNPISDR